MLAPLSARDGAFRLNDKRGRGEDLLKTDPSPLAMEMQEKEAEMQRILNASNPNSRPGTREKSNSRGKSREKKKTGSR